MYCQICGNPDNIKFYPAKHSRLCQYCASETPQKMHRAVFDSKYWENPDEVPESTKHEFYDDYKYSKDNFEQYVANTVSPNHQ